MVTLGLTITTTLVLVHIINISVGLTILRRWQFLGYTFQICGPDEDLAAFLSSAERIIWPAFGAAVKRTNGELQLAGPRAV